MPSLHVWLFELFRWRQWWRQQCDCYYASSEVEPGLTLDGNRLHRKCPARSAYQHVRAETCASSRLGANSSIRPRQRSVWYSRRSNHAPNQMPLIDYAERDTELVDASKVGFGWGAVGRRENTRHGLLLHEDHADTRRHVAGKRAYLRGRLCRSLRGQRVRCELV